MKKQNPFQLAIVILTVTISAMLFTNCQNEPAPVETEQTSLQKFSLPAGATFVSASFNVKINVATNQQIDIHRVTSPWEEMEVTWNNFGGYDPQIVNSFTASAVGWTSVDVTSLVGGWLNGTYPNYGLLLDQVNKTWPRTEFDTREYNFSADASYLKICYTLNGSLVCDTIRNIGDTYIYELNPDENNGAKGEMYTGWGYSNDLEKQALVKFDLGYTPTPQYKCETAYAYGGEDISTCFLDISPRSSNNWGWTNLISPGYTGQWPLYAGAGQCDISKGTLVGHVDVSYIDGTITIDYVLDDGFSLDEKHVWIGGDKLPMKRGIYQTAPGKFNYNNMDPVVVTNQTGPKYVAVHAGVCWIVK